MRRVISMQIEDYIEGNGLTKHSVLNKSSPEHPPITPGYVMMHKPDSRTILTYFPGPLFYTCNMTGLWHAHQVLAQPRDMQ